METHYILNGFSDRGSHNGRWMLQARAIHCGGARIETKDAPPKEKAGVPTFPSIPLGVLGLIGIRKTESDATAHVDELKSFVFTYQIRES
jgi:hypothetical protein